MYKSRRILILIISIILLASNITVAYATEPSANDIIIKRGYSGEDVINIQMRLRDLGYFNYKVTGYYGTYTKQAVKDFQKENNITADGIIGAETLEILYSSKAKRLEQQKELANRMVPTFASGFKYGEMLNWFDKVQYIIPRQTTFKVFDVNTQRSFYMIRTGGYNHADSEPKTAKDAQIIKEIWGGWSWARRAVVVMVDGYAIAASMHGMPHAFDRWPDNGMSGHVCVHFYKSRTHATNSSDSDHQRMVKKASGK